MLLHLPGLWRPSQPWKQQLRSGSFPLMVVVLLGLLVLRSANFVWGDTWFNVVLGRQVAESGVISRDATTALGWGTPVVDVQWLAHLIFYVIADHVGIVGLVSIGATWIAGSIVFGAAMALRAGATPGRVLLTTLVAVSALGSPLVLRAQTLVYPLLVLFPAALWHDARWPDKRTWWLVPATVLWANLHGSVLLAPIFGGALLVARVLDAWRAGRPIARRLAARDLALMLAMLGAIFCTPYGLDVSTYYLQTAGNPIFREYVTEWWPLWRNPDAFRITLLVIIACVIVRSGKRSDSFPVLVLCGLCVMQVSSIRHATPLVLASLSILPSLLDAALGRWLPMDFQEFTPRRAAGTLVVAASIFAVGVPMVASHSVASPGPSSAEARVASEAGAGCLLVDELQADRLMWYYPHLAGRLSHSVRIETIPQPFIEQLGTAYAAPATAASQAFFRRYPLVAMDDRLRAPVIAALSRDPQFELIAKSGSLHVFRHRRAASLPDPCAAFVRSSHSA